MAVGNPPRAAAPKRPPTSNELLCLEFRKLLTVGFYTITPDGEIEVDAGLACTKPWRGEVWTAFRALEDRLCPVAKFERTGLV